MTKRSKYFCAVIAGLALLTGMGSVVSAHEEELADNAESDRGESGSQGEVERGNGISTQEKNRNEKGDSGVSEGEHYRSDIAEVVLKLISLAEGDQNIGEEVRRIVQEEQDLSERAAESIRAVENRSVLKTFLIGADYENLAALRGELAVAQDHIDRLIGVKERAVSLVVQAEIDAQKKALQGINARAEEFIKNNESKFSLFGWLARLLLAE